MALFKPFRGNRASLDAVEKHDGYAYFCTDDGSFHIDYTDENGNLQRKQINAKDAETLINLSNELKNKQDKLEFDTIPVADSVNPITSGGVYEALQNLGSEGTRVQFITWGDDD